jgi:hypothetical protein
MQDHATVVLAALSRRIAGNRVRLAETLHLQAPRRNSIFGQVVGHSLRAALRQGEIVGSGAGRICIATHLSFGDIDTLHVRDYSVE